MRGFKSGKYGSTYSWGIFKFEDYEPIRKREIELGFDCSNEENIKGYCIHRVHQSKYCGVCNEYEDISVVGIFTTLKECKEYIKRNL